jgi:hypothetical protein
LPKKNDGITQLASGSFPQTSWQRGNTYHRLWSMSSLLGIIVVPIIQIPCVQYFSKIILLSFFICLMRSPAKAYSVLTHEAIIDANWETILLPLLKQKFPSATAEELRRAHAFAYGGAVAPDLGYYPSGSKLFTNLVHYVRSGDFVENIVRDAVSLEDYAFALGVMCHYYADRFGHGLGINPGVPLIYHKMREKFGDTVTYADNRISHVRTEFSFDVLQTARGNYASAAYHDFIGFEVDKPLLERAFKETYGLDINELFGDFPKAVSRFRWVVMNLFPFITKTAWARKKSDIRKLVPTATSRNFIYKMKRRNYNKEFGSQYGHPGFFAFTISFLIRFAPKIGPLRVLKFKMPGPDAEKLFIKSFDTTAARYGTAVSHMTGNMQLGNIDFDTGKRTEAGEYKLADKTYGDWLVKLSEKNFQDVGQPIKSNILNFYSGRNGPELSRPVSQALNVLRK